MSGKVQKIHKPDGLFGVGIVDLQRELNYVQETCDKSYLHSVLKGDCKPKLMHIDVCEALSEVAAINGLSGRDLQEFAEATFSGVFGKLIDDCSVEAGMVTNL